MKVYHELEALKDPSLAPAFAEAEAEREAISRVIFDKNGIIAFNSEYDVFSPENLAFIMSAVDEILSDGEYISLCCAMYHFMRKDISIIDVKPPQDGSLKSEFALMPPLIAQAADFCRDAAERGVEVEILVTTLKAIDKYITSNVRRTGRVGTSGYHFWLPLYAMGKLFRIGAFQFELRTHKGEMALGVHIPNGTRLDVRENTENFLQAYEFFKRHYPEYDFKCFICESWLLNPYIEKIMGRPTNITRFGDMFDRFEIDEEDDGVFISVFGVVKPDSLDALCENTSLQRNIKAWLKEGNRFKDYGGTISIDKLRKSNEAF